MRDEFTPAEMAFMASKYFVADGPEEDPDHEYVGNGVWRRYGPSFGGGYHEEG